MTNTMAEAPPGPHAGPGSEPAGRSIADSLVLRILARRLVRVVGVFLVLAVATFALVRLVPGDPARNAVGLSGDPAAYARAREQMHLDDSLLTQFGYYLRDLAHFDLGMSYRGGESVVQVIAARLPATLEITGLAIALTLIVSVPLGLSVAASTHSRRRWLRTMFTSVTGTFGGLPHYVTATLLVFLFAITLRWLPPSGSGGIEYLILPAIALAARPTAMLSRLVRVEATRVQGQDYVRTARSKRLPAVLVTARHVFPNVLTPTLAVTGTLVASLISGAVIIEQVFARPGLGTELVNAVLTGNYPVVQGITILLGLIVVLVNTIVDLAITVVDPQAAAGADQ